MEGDEGFEGLFARHYPRLVRALWAYCGDPAVAEEAAQEAFVRASRDWRRLSRLDSPAAWLHRVGVNEVNGHFRRLGRRDRAVSRLGGEEARAPVDIVGAVALQQAMRRLPDRQRLALALHYLADLPVAEVAHVLDAPPGTVKSLLSRGRDALRAELNPTSAKGKERDDVH